MTPDEIRELQRRAWEEGWNRGRIDRHVTDGDPVAIRSNPYFNTNPYQRSAP